MTDRKVPFTPDAESAVLGSMILSHAARVGALDQLATDDFYVQQHQVIFQALAALEAHETPVDCLTLAAECSVSVATLRAIEASTPASVNWEAYARLVLNSALARRAIGVADALDDAARNLDLAAVERVAAGIDQSLRAGPDLAKLAPEVSELIAVEHERAWLARGLLERGDRMILTGTEGWGKTTYLRQLAVQFASGIHPIYRTREPKLTVLHVDVENSEAQSARAYRSLLAKAGPEYSERRLFVMNRPQGINLCERRDQRWLEGLFHAHRPDVVVVGPLYKLFRGSVERSKQSEEAAEQTSMVLDKLRVRYQCALLMEAHSPHGASENRAEFRPTGSSLWLRWPEFGLGMVPIKGDESRCSLRAWRGARERDRCWPTLLIRGNHWPWESPEIEPPQQQFTDGEKF